jgi:hypothetical protein
MNQRQRAAETTQEVQEEEEQAGGPISIDKLEVKTRSTTHVDSNLVSAMEI